jgi:hypothetical protein
MGWYQRTKLVTIIYKAKRDGLKLTRFITVQTIKDQLSPLVNLKRMDGYLVYIHYKRELLQ